jgi:hypothetical protein
MPDQDLQKIFSEMLKLVQKGQETIDFLKANQTATGSQATHNFPNMPRPGDHFAPKFDGKRATELIKFFDDLEKQFTMCNVEEKEKAKYI